jgi:tetratricopeptide (TPR) repeat protein
VTADLDSADDSVGLAYDAVAEAVVALDETALAAAVGPLLETLAGRGDAALEEAVGIGLDLVDGWLAADEIAAGQPEGSAAALRSLILGVLVRLGDRFPNPAFAPAFDEIGLEVMDAQPELAAELLQRAVDLAETDAERAEYLVSLAFAAYARGQWEVALQLAERARRGAGTEDVRDAADGLVLGLLDETGSPSAVPHALRVLSERGDTLSDDVGHSIVGILIGEAARQEELERPVSVEFATGLRAVLDHPGWLPGTLTRSDFATVVAWTDFLRDDLRLLESTIDEAVGPFSDPLFAAQAALLRVMVSVTGMDVIGAEQRLRAAAPLVESAADPGLTTSYRALATMLAAARGGRWTADPAAELAGLRQSQARAVAEEPLLYQDLITAIGQLHRGESTGIPDELADRLDAWCSRPDHVGTDLMAASGLWGMGAAVAMLRGDGGEASRRLERMTGARSGLGDDAPQASWLDLWIAALGSALGGSAGARFQRGESKRHHRAGEDFAAFLADTQLALMQADLEPSEALAAAVRALAFRSRHLAALPASSERIQLREQDQRLVIIALRAAARVGDPELMAELLEFLRAQHLPVVESDPGPGGLPLAALLPPAAFGGAAGVPVPVDDLDAVVLPAALPVRMPWGRVALATILPPTGQPCTDLVVPLLPEG